MKPRVYLAGKIDKNDWRHCLVPGLREQLWKDGPIDLAGFKYVGPFFVSCDHGCNHQPSSHGATGGYAFDESTFTRADVIKNNMAALRDADLIFAYITTPDCFGTLVELGWSLHARKRVVIAYAPGMPVDDFWYLSGQVTKVYFDVNELRLQKLLNHEIRNFNKPKQLTKRKYQTLLEFVGNL